MAFGSSHCNGSFEYMEWFFPRPGKNKFFFQISIRTVEKLNRDVNKGKQQTHRQTCFPGAFNTVDVSFYCSQQNFLFMYLFLVW